MDNCSTVKSVRTERLSDPLGIKQHVKGCYISTQHPDSTTLAEEAGAYSEFWYEMLGNVGAMLNSPSSRPPSATVGSTVHRPRLRSRDARCGCEINRKEASRATPPVKQASTSSRTTGVRSRATVAATVAVPLRPEATTSCRLPRVLISGTPHKKHESLSMHGSQTRLRRSKHESIYLTVAISHRWARKGTDTDIWIEI